MVAETKEDIKKLIEEYNRLVETMERQADELHSLIAKMASQEDEENALRMECILVSSLVSVKKFHLLLWARDMANYKDDMENLNKVSDELEKLFETQKAIIQDIKATILENIKKETAH